MKQKSFTRRHPRSARAARWLAACAVLALAACARGEPPPLGPVITLAARGATNPTVAIDGARARIYVAWVGVQDGAANVFLTRSDDGQTFDAPVRVNDIDGDAAPHDQAPAQVAVGEDGEVYVVWQNNVHVEDRRLPYSDLRLARSLDGGQSFDRTITVNDDAGSEPASHTFHDVIVARNGTVYVSWIDGRAHAAAERAVADSAAADSEAAGAEGAGADSADHAENEVLLPPHEIRIAWSTDGGNSFGASTIVALDPCPCCRTALGIAPDGALLLGRRGILEGGIRDIVVARSMDGGASFSAATRVHVDDWRIDDCPQAGPSIATATDSTVFIAWYTGSENQPGVHYVSSRDGGRSFGNARPLLVGEDIPVSRVRLAPADGGRVLAAWDDRRSEPARPVVAWIDHGRVTRDTLTVTGTAPAVAAAGALLAVAWLDGDRIRVRTSVHDPD